MGQLWRQPWQLFENQMLVDEDLRAIFEYLQWQYQMPEFAMARPGVVKVACYEGMSSPEGGACIWEMKDLMEKFKYVVCSLAHPCTAALDSARAHYGGGWHRQGGGSLLL